MYLNKNLHCLEFDLTGFDFGFTIRFWISMTELFVAMNSFMITERSKNQWHSNNIKVILPNFAKNYSFWTLWTLNYVDCIPFSCIDYFQILFLNFQKTWLNLKLFGSNLIKSVLFICPSVCLPVCDAFSSGSTLWIFKNFFAWGYFAIYTKKWRSDNLFVV